MKIRKLVTVMLGVSLLLGNISVVNAANMDNAAKFDTESNNDNLSVLQSEIITDEVTCEFTNKAEEDTVTPHANARRTANKYMWSSRTMKYDFSDQTWSTNKEIFSTYSKTSGGFVMSGFLVNPKGQKDYNTALREGYLNDSAYAENQGHYYQDVVSGEGNNNVTFMLESNVNVFIFDKDVNLIYRSSDEAGVTSYFTRYYSTSKLIAGQTNKVISLGLVDGNYYFVFDVKNATATSGYHYGYYAGQPLPIAQTSTFYDHMHNTRIQWDKRSSSQSANTQTMTINCPIGSEDEYALTSVRFIDRSKAFANNTYASRIDYYYTPATASYSTKLTQTGGWWSDLVDNNPASGSIDGDYKTSVTVNWVSGLAYVNASCTTMTNMTINYLVPFGIIAD